MKARLEILYRTTQRREDLMFWELGGRKEKQSRANIYFQNQPEVGKVLTLIALLSNLFKIRILLVQAVLSLSRRSVA